MPHLVEGGALARLPGTTLLEALEAEERELMECAVKEARDAGVEAKPAFITGTSPYEAILRVATEQACDLIVMASHGRRGLSGLLVGSETKKLLTHVVGTSVLIVR